MSLKEWVERPAIGRHYAVYRSDLVAFGDKD